MISALPPGAAKTFVIPIGRVRELHQDGHLSHGVYRVQLSSFWWRLPYARENAIDPVVLLSNEFGLLEPSR